MSCHSRSFLVSVVLAAGSGSASAAAEPGLEGELVAGTPESSVRGMTVWQAVILGVVEGVTEYLPVSLNPRHPTPTGDSWAGRLEKQFPSSRTKETTPPP